MVEQGSNRDHSKVTLKEILKGYGQPISEEQAWALCFQCCNKLKQLLWGSMQEPVLRGVDNILIHQDGTVSFTACQGVWENHLSEQKIIKDLRQVIYIALDWGLTNDLERALSEPLDHLLHLMLGLHTAAFDTKMYLQDTITFNEVIQLCSERLFTPSKASSHYRTVCRVYFAEHKEFGKLLLTIERSKKKLKLLDSEDKEALILFDNWGNVLNELRLGVKLQKAKERSFQGLPVEYTFSPYELLMNDIRHKLYTLREVKDKEKTKRTNREGNFNTELFSSQTLRPASARKLKERSQEEPSLHEMLMTEIKSGQKLRQSSKRMKHSIQEDEDSGTQSNLSSTPSNDSLPSLDYPVKSSRRRLQTVGHMDMESDGESSWQSKYSSESSSDRKFSDLTSSITDLMFVPVLTSSQVDLKTGSFLNNDKLKYFGHRRSRSYEISLQKNGCRQNPQFPRICSPPTIAELVPARRDIINAEVVDFLQCNGYSTFSGSRVCFSCHKKRLFFTWPYTCKFCERVICPECCVEMLMPFKQCMHLPVSFFKTLVLTQEDNPACHQQKAQMFFRETMHWDCSSVPLVFEPQDLVDGDPFHKKAMKNWPSMDICIKCEEYILEMVDGSKACALPSERRRLRCSCESF
ncbi:protein spire homolog 2-like [Bombina bombina]|uniref:protein spire homolog 2-like n=1 Tax=Bombina bombina TaxID=8345 RepID=UPI00235AD29E|nr:protein spire homolog 2-like [Bombina bombina]